jgi:glyoxylase I family protein
MILPVPPITGFHHVSFSVNDVDRSARWYGDVLGFEIVLDNRGPHFRRVRLRHPDCGITVTLTGHHRGSGDRFSEVRTGLDHLAFSVASGDIEAWKRRFEEHGVEHSEIRSFADGGGIITLRDPDNIQLEVFAPPRR